MKKIILCIMLSIFLTSCGTIASYTQKTQIKVPDVHKGTQGVMLEFLKDMPPSEIYEDRYFEAGIKIQNKGAVDILRGMLVIGVEEQQMISEGPSDERFDLVGKSVYNPEGSQDILRFKIKTRPLEPKVEHYPTEITATACYPYKTEATALMCIDTDILNIVKTKPCTPRMQGFSGGQGAPIAVVSVEPKMLVHADPERVQPEFYIKLQNVGQGNAMMKDRVYDACSGKSLGPEAWNVVELNAYLSDTPLNCRPEKIKLAREARVICTLDEGIDKTKGTYTAPLSIEVNYGYMDRLVKRVEIKKITSKSI